jgi:hypothetical protein
MEVARPALRIRGRRRLWLRGDRLLRLRGDRLLRLRGGCLHRLRGGAFTVFVAPGFTGFAASLSGQLFHRSRNCGIALSGEGSGAVFGRTEGRTPIKADCDQWDACATGHCVGVEATVKGDVPVQPILRVGACRYPLSL